MTVTLNQISCHYTYQYQLLEQLPFLNESSAFPQSNDFRNEDCTVEDDYNTQVHHTDRNSDFQQMLSTTGTYNKNKRVGRAFNYNFTFLCLSVLYTNYIKKVIRIN